MCLILGKNELPGNLNLKCLKVTIRCPLDRQHGTPGQSCFSPPSWGLLRFSTSDLDEIAFLELTDTDTVLRW
jgi:hypothetical protein